MERQLSCIVITKDNATNICGEPITFQNGFITNDTIRKTLEDYYGIPIMSIRETTRTDNEIMLLCANGFVQTNPITKKRTTVLQGDAYNICNALETAFEEHIDTPIQTIFDEYSLMCSANDRIQIHEWIKSITQ